MANGELEQKPSISEFRAQLVCLGLLRATEAIAWTSIFPYVYFMLRSFNEVPTSKITFYAGLLIAVFTFSEFLSNMFWSRVSDKIGRKKTLLIGSTCGMVTSLWFGLSRSITSAVVSRAFGGLSNPNVSLVQTCAVELTTKDEQRASALSLVAFFRSMGNLVGPVLGGLLGDPATNYPSLFPSNSIWTSYPFLLPNLAVAFLQLSTFTSALLLLEETHPKLAKRPDEGLRLAQAILGIFSRKQTVSRPERGHGYEALDGEEPRQNSINSKLDSDDETSRFELQTIPHSSASQTDHTGDETTSHPDINNSKTKADKAFTVQIILQILSVSLLAFHKVSSDAVMPVFLATPATSPDNDSNSSDSPNHPQMEHPQNSIFRTPNGFGYSNQTIGFILLSQAIVAALVQIRLVPYFIDKNGALKAYRIVLFIYPILYLFTPFLPATASPLPMVLVLLELWCKVILSSVGYICSTILITKTAPRREFLARINGASASFSCLARSMGPIITGKLFEVGEKIGYGGVAFWVLSAVALVGGAESFLLRDYI